MKILIDSDVCLDFITGRSPFGSPAHQLFAHIESEQIPALVSPHSFPNMYYILSSQYRVNNIIPKLKDLRALVDITPLTGVEIDYSLDSGWNDFEDAIQYYCAKENSCDAVITRNRRDYKNATLEILSPRQFLDQIAFNEEE